MLIDSVVTYTYDVSLEQPVRHHDPAQADDVEGSVTLAGVGFVATDSDNDTTDVITTDDDAIDVVIYDDIPVAEDAQTVEMVYEADLGSSSPSGEDLQESEGFQPIASGTVSFAFGADGPGGITDLSFVSSSDPEAGDPAVGPLTSGGEGLVYSQSADLNGKVTLTASRETGGEDVFTLSLDADGNYVFEQLRAIDHPDLDEAFSDDPLDLNFSYTIADDDGDSAGGAITVQVKDDAPFNFQTASADTIVLDESAAGVDPDGPGDAAAGTSSATANFANNFFAIVGVDTPGSTSYALDLDGTDVASGLFALGTAGAQGDAILLNQASNGDIVGAVAGSSTPHFTISVDSDGEVTFTQSQNIWHATDSDDDDKATLTLSDPTALTISQTVTDFDGDSSTASINLGSGVFSIEDDGPDAVALGVLGDALVLDETRPEGTDSDGASAPGGLASTTADFSDNFQTTIDYGTDGEGSVDYSLTLSGANVGSGLFSFDPQGGKGDEIVLNLVGDDVVGTANGTPHFTISVDSDGEITFSQSENIWHDDDGDHDDAETLTLSGDDYLRIEQTVSDADGDSDSDFVDLGSGVFTIQDDGPTAAVNTQATPDALVVDESAADGSDPDSADGVQAEGTSVDTAEFADNFLTSGVHGTDGPGNERYALVLTSASVASGLFALDITDIDPAGGLGKGQEIILTQDATSGVISGTAGASGSEIFTIEIGETSGTVTLTQKANLWHEDTTSDDAPETLALAANTLLVEQTVSDADGDEDSISIDVSDGVFAFEDDGPTIGVAIESSADLNVAEDSINDTASVVLDIDFGTDGGSVAASFGSAIDPEAEDSADNPLTLTSGGVGVEVVSDNNGGLIGQLVSDGTDVFTLVFNDGGDGTGTYTFNLLGTLDHPDGDPDLTDTTAVSETDADDQIQLNFTITATDGDGDSESQAVTVTIDDDGPVDFTPDATAVINRAGSSDMAELNVFESVGADGLGAATFVNINTDVTDNQLFDANGTAVTLFEGGAPVFLYGFGTDTLIASTSDSGAGGTPGGVPQPDWVFRVSLDADDQVEVDDKYTVELFQKLDDNSGLDFNNLLGLSNSARAFHVVEGTDPVGGPDEDLILTAINATTVNASSQSIFPQGSVGVGNQAVNNGEGLRLDFVEGQTATDGALSDIDFTGGHTSVNGVSLQAGQFLGAGGFTEATITVSLWSVRAADLTLGASTNFDQTAAISDAVNVAFVQANGVDIDPARITIDGNSVTITGVTELEPIEVFGVEAFNRVEALNDGSPGRLDFGAFGAGTSEAGDNLDLSFGVQLADADGDTVITEDLNVQIQPEATVDGATIIGGAAADLLIGSDGNDTFIGNGGDDTLTGGENADTGSDLFVFDETAVGGTTTITDFDIDDLAGGDVDTIDLDALFDELDVTEDFGASREDNVVTQVVNTDDVEVTIQNEGGATVGNFKIVLEDVGVSPDLAQIEDQIVNDDGNV